MPVVAGRVRDTAGAPVAQARVAFADAPVPVPDVAALTGPDGRFALSAPAPGRYAVLAAADGHEAARVSVDVGDRAELEITLLEERR
jgi:carboxypeptidase family protein